MTDYSNQSLAAAVRMAASILRDDQLVEVAYMLDLSADRLLVLGRSTTVAGQRMLKAQNECSMCADMISRLTEERDRAEIQVDHLKVAIENLEKEYDAEHDEARYDRENAASEMATLIRRADTLTKAIERIYKAPIRDATGVSREIIAAISEAAKLAGVSGFQ